MGILTYQLYEKRLQSQFYPFRVCTLLSLKKKEGQKLQVKMSAKMSASYCKKKIDSGNEKQWR